MNRVRSGILGLSALAFLMVLLVGSEPASAVVWVAYVKSSRQYVGNDVSEKSVMVTGEGDVRIAPQWSGDGKFAVFGRSHEVGGRIIQVSLDVAGRTGEIQHSLVMNYADQGNVRMAGARAVKIIGWFGAGQVYVIGDINPKFDEMRVFDVQTGGEQKGYLGAAFAVCRSAARVAYLAQRGNAGVADIFVNDDTLATVDNGETSGSIRFLLWDAPCTRLFAVRQAEGASELVSVESGAIKRLRRLPGIAYVRVKVIGSWLRLVDFDGSETFIDLDRPDSPVQPNEDLLQDLRFDKGIESAINSGAFDVYR